jgi:glutamate-5-semialdehyde dehydrogenase
MGTDALTSLAESIGRRARAASRLLAAVPGEVRHRALHLIAGRLRDERAAIQSENAADIAAARAAGLPSAMIDRLTLNDKRVEAMARGTEEVAAQVDPVGHVLESSVRPNGLCLEKVRVPIGVVLIIYESRPNVTVDAAALCLKSGNACILRTGKEAVRSSLALARVIADALEEAGLPRDAVQVVDRPEHELVNALLVQDRWIDLVIPRGGERLIRAVVEQSTIPVIKHYKGVCHVYIDEFADLAKATPIVVNAKCQRPGVCNAMECLLVHQAHAGTYLAGLLADLTSRGVEIRGCERTRRAYPTAKPASESDWGAEYLDLILAVRVVDSIEEAIDHIARFGSAHTDAIVTENRARAEQFVRDVDSSSVMVNASTRFSDGGEYGLGAEVGISTDKLHARGPMGAADLTTYKYVVRGQGQVRA